jgi:hypothetical protein
MINLTANIKKFDELGGVRFVSIFGYITYYCSTYIGSLLRVVEKLFRIFVSA